MMSTSALLGVVAELWTEVLTDARTAEARAGLRKLDVAAVLWSGLRIKVGRSARSRRFNIVVKAEAAWDGCMGRLRLAAEMIGLGKEEVPWSEAKSLFFFWALPLCVPQKRMKQHLLDVELHLPMSIVVQLCSLAVRNEKIRDVLLKRLQEASIANDMLAVTELAKPSGGSLKSRLAWTLRRYPCLRPSRFRAKGLALSASIRAR